LACECAARASSAYRVDFGSRHRENS
jgi:hypothetical protein